MRRGFSATGWMAFYSAALATRLSLAPRSDPEPMQLRCREPLDSVPA